MARTRRLAVRGSIRRAATRRVCEALLRHPKLRNARCVALYLAAGSELSLQSVIDRLQASGRSVCLPRVAGCRLHFYRHRTGQALRRGAFGLLEPATPSQRVALRGIDVVVVPLVAFDPDGGRIGQGGGYYDRAFSRRRSACTRMPYLIGAAFGAQRVAHVDMRPWDVPMDAIVHDKLTLGIDEPRQGTTQ